MFSNIITLCRSASLYCCARFLVPWNLFWVLACSEARCHPLTIAIAVIAALCVPGDGQYELKSVGIPVKSVRRRASQRVSAVRVRSSASRAEVATAVCWASRRKWELSPQTWVKTKQLRRGGPRLDSPFAS